MGLVDRSIGLMIAVVVIAGVTIPMIGNTLVLNTRNVANETFDATTLVYNYTVDSASSSDFYDTAQAQGYNTTAQSATVPTQILDSKAGLLQFNYTGKVGSAVDLSTYEQSVQYKYEPQNYVQNDTSRLVLGFVIVGAAVGLLVAAFSFAR